jgi:hypothetical protein
MKMIADLPSPRFDSGVRLWQGALRFSRVMRPAFFVLIDLKGCKADG